MDQKILPEGKMLAGFDRGQPHDVVIDGKTVSHHRQFYRGEKASFWPSEESFERDDFLQEYCAKGTVPEAPVISTDTVVVAFGSCFAKHISDHLAGLGFRVESRNSDKAYISLMGDGIVNTYAVRQQFEWAWEGKVPEVSLWHGYDGRQFGYDDDVRLETKRIFDKAEVFIITLGLSEIWYDEPTGHVFWRAVPKDHFDPSRHKFRTASPAENTENLKAIHAIIRRNRPDARIVFTLSPIPLQATFRPMSCIVANSASKASLRCAVDALMTDAGDPGLYYFPSYEVVTTLFSRPFTYDRRHVFLHILDLNMRLFERYYCRSGITDERLGRIWQRAQRIDRRYAKMEPLAIEELEKAEQERRTEGNKAFRVERRRQMQARRAARLERLNAAGGPDPR
ncbi:MAG TPA: GSCFA domain-containing protein [Alphaproteobacteria bacterium]|nr:GSCFA domain-containing protein [Alphaproteobacteria bacterium]